MPTTAIPPPFRTSPQQPSPETPIPDLLAKGHYRAAAAAAAQALIASPSPPPDAAQIYSLLHVRLACLTLTDNTALAAQEVRSLPPDLDDAAATPWPLRVLAVRLRALGYGDQRRAVMSYYDLAREARAALAAAAARGDRSATELWRERLGELGVRVAGALVEMDDLAGAAQLLAGLRDRGDGALAVAKALLWLHLGDADAARGCARGLPGRVEAVVDALCAMADGEYGAALDMWKALREEEPEDEMVGVNMAVCLLYVGRMQEASQSIPAFLRTVCS